MTIESELRGVPIFFRQPGVRLVLLISLFCNLVSWGLVVWVINLIGNRQLIPLHYTIYFGIDWVGDWLWLVLWPGVGTVVLLLNTAMARILMPRYQLLSYLVLGACGIVSILTLLLSGSIAYINL